MKKIGDLNGAAIHSLATYGGLIILAKMSDGEPEIIAMAPHLFIAKDIAEKKHKSITWNK